MRRRWMVTLIGVAACAIGLATPASAHGDDGTMQVVSITSPAPLSLRVEANITFVGDGHAAPAATATVRAGATTVGPITLIAAGTTGRYSATVALASPATTAVAPTTLADPSTTVPSEPGKDRVATTLVFIGVLVAIAIVAALAVRSSRRARGTNGGA